MIESEFKELESKLAKKYTRLDKLNLIFDWSKSGVIKVRQFRRLVDYCF